MIEGVFDETIFDEAAFQVDEIEAFAVERTGIEAAFSQDHGPITLLPHEIAQRRKLWVKFLRDWVQLRREKKKREELELLSLFALVTDGAVTM